MPRRPHPNSLAALLLPLLLVLGLSPRTFAQPTPSPRPVPETAAEQLAARLAANDLQGAIEQGNLLLPGHGEDPRFLEQLGRTYFVLSERLEAADRPLTQINRARQESLIHLRGARERWPGVPPRSVPLAIALLELDLGDPTRAIESATIGISDHPDYGDLYRTRAHARTMLGEWEPAIEDWKKTLERYPGDVDAALGWSRVLERTGRACDGAEIIHRHCIAPGVTAAQRPWRAHYEYARTLVICGRLEDSLTPFAEAARLAPKEPIVAIERAELLYRTGNHEGAGEIFEQWLAKPEALDRPQRLQALYRRGRIAFAAGDLERARADFEGAYALDPSHEGVLKNLGSLLRRAGETERAEELLERFRRLAPVALDIRITRSTVRQNPRLTRPRIELIQLLLRVPDLEAARLELAEFEKSFPGHPMLPNVRARIEARSADAKTNGPAAEERR